jgi:hypothetical protein
MPGGVDRIRRQAERLRRCHGRLARLQVRPGQPGQGVSLRLPASDAASHGYRLLERRHRPLQIARRQPDPA